MAKEVQFVIPAGPTDAYFILRNIVGQYWNPSTPAFEAYNASHWTDYAIALSRDGSSQQYNGDCPAIPSGVYGLICYNQVGGAAATSDTFVEFQRRFEWSGTAQVSLDSRLKAANQLRGTVSVTSTAGTTAHVKVQMTDQLGQVVDIHALDAAATCAVTVIRDGGATQFSLSTSDFGAPSSSVGWFEADYANPSFTADRGYTIEATVVAAGVTYKGSSTFFVVP